MPTFSEWESFYVIVGSSAAALTGLQFVVIALTADMRRSSSRDIDAFATPTVIHFGAVLLLSGIVTAPWRGLAVPANLIALCGFIGFVYTCLVVRRARSATYQPVLEDWLFHAALPAAAYLLLASSALTLRRATHGALFVVATAALLLLFIGIHNAWDTATYVVVSRGTQPKEEPAKAPAETVERA